jgi:hypothetical protein
MYPFRYSASLRFRHPSIDPAKITQKLGKKPSRQWKAGEPRTTPKGNKLEGFNKESYWTANLHSKKSITSTKTEFEKFLSSALDELTPHSKFIKKILKECGSAEFFVGLYGSKNFGMELEPALLLRFGEIGIRLALDVYPEKEENKSEEIENLFIAIRSRFESLGPQKCLTESFLAHLRSLGRWEADGGNYPDPGEIAFPEKIHIAFAVCNQECGVCEYIVDGSTQECQKCGDLMFRTDVAEYQFLKKEQD